jgi:hypothetical protein
MANGEWNAEAAAGYVHEGVRNSLEYLDTAIDPVLLDETLLEIIHSQILSLRLKVRETRTRGRVVSHESRTVQ